MKHEYTHNYPSDITREQFALIKDELENLRTVTRPRDYELYDVFCAILYLIKSGCQWRMIPADFPPRGTVRFYYDEWAIKVDGEDSLFQRLLKKTGVSHSKR